MPLSELFNSAPSEEVTSLLGNLQKSFPSARSYGYDMAKTFVQTSSSSAGGGNGVTSLDDPTYLGFNIYFDRMSPLFEGALEGSPAIPANDDPFALSGGGAGELGSHPSGESAVGYLNNLGEVTRATYLKAFCQGLKEIESKRAYYFQTIEGLQEAFNKTVNMTPFGGSADGEGITVGLLEAIDLKMSALFNLYKSACYDVKYRRNLIPINLMYFTVRVEVVEVRRFKQVRNFINALNPLSPDPELSKFVNENFSKITFKFDECTWDAGASGQVFANVTNIQGDPGNIATSSMKWSYGRVEIESQFAGYDSALVDSAPKQPKTYKDLAKGAGKKLLDKAIQGAENLVQRKALSFVQGLKFGNVYGLGNQIINTIKNPQGLLSTLQGALVQEETTPGFTNQIGTNIYEGEIAPGGSTQTLEVNRILPEGGDRPPLTQTNVFTSAPSGPPPLEPSNLFEGDIPPGGSTQSIESSNIFED